MKSHDKVCPHYPQPCATNLLSLSFRQILVKPCLGALGRLLSAFIKHIRLAAAVVRVVADALALADLYAGLGVVGGCGAHALLDLAGHGEESLLDVAGVLGRGLEEGDSEGVGKFLRAC